MKVVALSGSLRAGSSNAALLRAAAALAPEGLEVVFYEGLGGLPHFNPDLDAEGLAPPPPVAALRALLGSAQGFVVSCPEYAHGVPGAFKNGLDWVVSSGELVGKPALLLNASPTSGKLAQAQVAETLSVMSATVLPESITAPFGRRPLDARGLPADEGIAAALRSAMAALAKALVA